MLIMNGRFGKDVNVGNKPCKNSSTVDYIIITPSCIESILHFEILDFDPLISDVHCPVYADFKILQSYKVENVNLGNKPTKTEKCLWNSDRSELVNEHLCTTDVFHIERKLNEAESTPQSVSLELINGIVGDLCQVLKRSASACGMSKPTKVTDGKPRRWNLPHKPWYNTDCEDARHAMMQCKNKYRKVTNSENSNLKFVQTIQGSDKRSI